MRRHLSIALAAAVAAAASLAAGCGSGSAPAGGAGSGAPHPTVFHGSGVTFTAPAGWTLRRGTGHLVATVRSGDGTVAIWRFPRKQPLPATTPELAAARDALVVVLHRHDAAFTALASAPTEIAGQRAVQIRAHETIDGVVRTIRTSHVYAGGSEYVIDAYADEADFREVDARWFHPLLRSMEIQGSAQDAA